MTRLSTLITFAVFVGVLWHAPAASQSSPYVSTMDAAYEDVDALIAMGLLPDAIVAQRPYSRAVFASFSREAGANMAGAPGRVNTPRIREALARLTTRFLESGTQETFIAVREAALDATLARSPDRTIPTNYADFGHPIVDRIDAVLNPLLQRNQGRVLADGGTGGAEAEADLRLGSSFSGQVRARVSSAWSGEEGASANLMLQRGYLRAQAGNTVLDVGREYAFNGQGLLGGSVFSGNARALDMVRLSSDAPFHLPGLLRRIGVFELSATLGDMGADRDVPHSKVIVFEGSWRPSAHFEVGGVLLNIQGGDGAPEATLNDRLSDIFLWLIQKDRLAISDKIFGINTRFTVPDLGLEVYFDGLTTDINWSRWESLWDEAAWIAGGRITGLGQEGRLDVFLEGRRTGVRPYTHHTFTSGVTLDQRVMGAFLGPMATGWEVGVDWNATDDQLSFSGAWERYRGDEYRNNGLGGKRFRWDLWSDNPDEIRVRLEGQWLRRPNAAGFYTQIRVGYERVTRFAFTDDGRSNAMVQAKVGWFW